MIKTSNPPLFEHTVPLPYTLLFPTKGYIARRNLEPNLE